MTREEFLEFLKEKKALVDQKLEELLPERDEPGARVISAMRYSLMAGGKRLRPVLCMLGAEAVGRRGEDFLLFACGLECLHTYSLIHDDLPAMDDDDLRRGKPTCHRAFDEATAILAGDGLLTLAFELFSSPELLEVTSPERLLQAVHLVAQAAGASGMVAGQMADLLAEGREISPEELSYIHRKKTAALLSASVVSGGLLAGAPANDLRALETYGEALGLAFQIVDDILDVVGEEEKLGKPVGADIRKKKATYPALLGLSEARNKAKELIETAVSALQVFGPKAEPLKALARFVLSRQN
ncbi:polyprenyl synthetase family protein [Thermosulfurimonas dismutans]|uniref:Octaprenyl-diphosphate synthase n=1 Tax=Thermosulfurimonas dismutans TaxID=999894 RepID=A0A179D5G5_9BACT|nr:farnesyl diphosphate synthase [Thermosulfurimonas dismutans]OAQ21335.1 Octaprenyl-diphosphate synthase [Thermosulfurimonas dismutans]